MSELVHLESCVNQGDGPCDCVAQYIERVKRDASTLADTLRDVSDAGVPHPLILPQLVLVFRSSFGEMPAGFTLPGMS